MKAYELCEEDGKKNNLHNQIIWNDCYKENQHICTFTYVDITSMKVDVSVYSELEIIRSE